MSLFLKIFLWFWLAMAIVGGALAFAISYVSSGQIEEWSEAADETLAVYGPGAGQAFEEGGAAALTRYLAQVDQNSGLRTALFDERGRPLTRRQVPQFVLRLAGLTATSGSPQAGNSSRLAGVTRLVTSDAGRRYVMAGVAPRRLIRGDSRPLDIALRALAVLITGGLLCYSLARYLTSPLLKLGNAARELAGGNLQARVGQAIGQRQDELAELAQDFDVMAGRIQDLVESQRRLLGDISHELRSPLARMSVALELLRKNSPPESNGYLDRVETETGRMNHLIEQLLVLARLEAEGRDAKRTRLSLLELLEQVVADANFEAQAQNRSVRLVQGESCEVNGTPEMLHSAIENVVRNAIRYAPEQTEVEVSLEVRRQSDHSAAVITIRDHGPGVPDGTVERIFHPFYRVGDARDRQSGGTGLGLAIAGRAIQFHGGNISARNAAGGGLLVEIHLPA